MIVQQIVNALKSSELSDCTMKIQIRNGKPQLVAMFDTSQATATDNDRVKQLRECFTYPLFSSAESGAELEEQASVELAHLLEELTMTAQDITAASASEKVANKRAKASQPSNKTTKKASTKPKPKDAEKDSQTPVQQPTPTAKAASTESCSMDDLFSLDQFTV